MNASPTFNCPFCGAPITGARPGSAFACPYCRANVVAPFAGQVAYGGAQAPVSLPHGHAPDHGRDRPFAAGPDHVAVGFDPTAGFVAVGPHSPHGEPPRLRAWSLQQNKLLWEALSGQSWTADLSRASFKIIGRNVYVAHKRQLMCFDLVTGARKWGSPLSDAVDGDDAPDRGLAIADPFPAGQRGAILVRAIDNTLYSFDRDSGQALWNKSYGDKTFDLAPVENLGAVVVTYGAPYVKADIVNPAYAQPIASLGHEDWSVDLGLCTVHGRTVVTAVDDWQVKSHGEWGPENDEEEGLLGFDAVTGQVHFFDKVDDLEDDDVAPAAMGPRVFAAIDGGAGIYVGPRGRPIACPVPNHVVRAFCAAGPTLVMLLTKAQGTAVRRVVGIDPTSLAFRFDAGEAGAEPDDGWGKQMITDGWSVVFVAAPEDDRERSQLRSIDTTTGRTRWSKPIGFWRGHAFVGGHVVAYSDDRIDVFAPANGEVVATLT